MDSDDDNLAVALQLKISQSGTDEASSTTGRFGTNKDRITPKEAAGKKSSTEKNKNGDCEDLPDGVYEVESIIAHSGDLKRKASAKFRVRWRGFKEEDDTWEPFWCVKKLSALTRYLDSINPGAIKKKKRRQSEEKDENISKKPKKTAEEHVVLTSPKQSRIAKVKA